MKRNHGVVKAARTLEQERHEQYYRKFGLSESPGMTVVEAAAKTHVDRSIFFRWKAQTQNLETGASETPNACYTEPRKRAAMYVRKSGLEKQLLYWVIEMRKNCFCVSMHCLLLILARFDPTASARRARVGNVSFLKRFSKWKAVPVLTIKKSFIRPGKTPYGPRDKENKFRVGQVSGVEAPVGDLVWIHNPPRGKNATKFVHQWQGYFALSNLLATKTSATTGGQERQNLEGNCHVLFLVSYHYPEPFLTQVTLAIDEELR
ncbi:hypothetical protein PHMEG_00018552 [Phytophthora megakarya]|uniref:Uncharacterized protein n=1 Tax=Phytophthora megakarya TaxID=4795 RepID=A0A225VUM1_9STRA|nr:hypothetical protein PHMEG_00018552 [Phytophthora megakarya]